MDAAGVKGKGKKNLITKTWERCKSIGRSNNNQTPSYNPSNVHRGLTKKSKSWPRSLQQVVSFSSSPPEQEEDTRTRSSNSTTTRKHRVTPEGCFSVYVGPEKQRFVIKTEYANHPLFKMLLEEAELEYGFNSYGPLELPCNVDVFYKVLVEMDDCDDDCEIRQGCAGFPKATHTSSYRLLSPSRMVIMNHL